MTFAIIFLLVFVALGLLTLYLSRTIEHGEARFGPDGKMIVDDRRPARPAQRIEPTDTAGDEQ